MEIVKNRDKGLRNSYLFKVYVKADANKNDKVAIGWRRLSNIICTVTVNVIIDDGFNLERKSS